MSGLGLQRPGDDIGVKVDARVSGPMSVSGKDQKEIYVFFGLT